MANYRVYDRRIIITLSLDESVLTKIRNIAKKKKIPVTKLINDWIAEKLL